MESDILDTLEDLGYTGPLLDESCLEKALDGGPKSVDYTALVEWVSKELKSLCQLEEHVNAITTAEDSSSFLLELSSFLKELGCVYPSLTSGHMSERLDSRKKRLLLLDFLLTELEAARMVNVNRPDTSKSMQVQLNESSTASDLKTMLIALKFPKPPTNITPALLFGKVEQKMKEVLSKASPELIGKPLFTGMLSDKQWQQLADIQQELQDEYRIRRELLIKRLDVTVQSFQWSDRVRQREDKIAALFLGHRKALVTEPDVNISDLLAAREDLAIIEKTSSASVRKNTQTSVNKVIIGKVPDRGGRPNEQQPPPPEMPSWQRSKPGGSDRGGGGGGGAFSGRGGGGGGDRGGRVQGGWNQGGGGGGGGGYQGGGYQGGGGGGYQGGGYQGGGGGGYQGGGYQGGGGGGYQGGGYQGGGGGGYQGGGGGYQGGGAGYQGGAGGYQGGGGGGYQGGGYQGGSGGYQGGGRGGGGGYRGGRGRGRGGGGGGGGWSRGNYQQDNYR